MFEIEYNPENWNIDFMFEIECTPEKWDMRLIDAYYLFCLISIVLILDYLLLSPPNDVDNARYMLSALVQSEAAIIAVVVSLSLVGVQLVASSYSARVIEVFKTAPYLWSLLLYYIVAMGTGLWVLMEIKEKTIHVGVIISYCLGIFAFVILIPYILNVLELLKPYSLIDKLAMKISNENILSTKNPGEQIDPIQPIIDIIIGSLKMHDVGVLIHGLNAIEPKIVSLFNSNDFDRRMKLSFAFLHLSSIGKLASNNNDEYAAIKIIGTINKIANAAADNGLLAASTEAVKSLKDTGVRAAEERLPDAASSSIMGLGDVTERFLQNISPYDFNSWFLSVPAPNGPMPMNLSSIENSIRQEFCEFAFNALGLIEDLGNIAIGKKLETVIELEVAAIEKVGLSCIERKCKSAAYKSTEALKAAGVTSVEQNVEVGAWESSFSLKNIGIKATEKQSENVANGAAGALGDIGARTIQHIQEIIPSYVVSEKLDEKIATLISIVERANEGLHKIALSGIANGLDSPVRIAAIEINRIRKKALEILQNEYQRDYIKNELRSYLEDIRTQASTSPKFRETIQVIDSLLNEIESPRN